MSNTFVCLMGIGTVFVGLISIIILCVIMSAVIRAFTKKQPENNTPVTETQSNTEIKDKQKIIAAVSCALAEELGTDVSAIRILSFKKL